MGAPGIEPGKGPNVSPTGDLRLANSVQGRLTIDGASRLM